jgi:hypothetical protein
MRLSPAHPVLRGDRDYLRALRAAEMKAWELTGGDSLTLADSSNQENWMPVSSGLVAFHVLSSSPYEKYSWMAVLWLGRNGPGNSRCRTGRQAGYAAGHECDALHDTPHSHV